MAINYVFDANALNAGRAEMGADFNYQFLETVRIGGIGSAFPGMVFPFQGRLFQVIQNRFGGAIARGDSVSLYLGDAARTGNLTGASTRSIVVTDDTLDASLAGDPTNPGVIAVTATALPTTADMTLRQILGNSVAAGASTVTVSKYERDLGPNFDATTVANAFPVLPDANYDYQVFCPWEVTKSDLDALGTSIWQGVCVSTTITDDWFGLIQIAGIGLAKVDGTTDLVVGDLLVPDAAAGVLSKWVVGAPTAAGVLQTNFICARILEAYTNNGVGLRLCQFNPTNGPLMAYPVTM